MIQICLGVSNGIRRRRLRFAVMLFVDIVIHGVIEFIILSMLVEFLILESRYKKMIIKMMFMGYCIFLGGLRVR
jgi:hypothetical protein